MWLERWALLQIDKCSGMFNLSEALVAAGNADRQVTCAPSPTKRSVESYRLPLGEPRNERGDLFHVLLVPRPSIQTPPIHHGNTDNEKECSERHRPNEHPPVRKVGSQREQKESPPEH